MLYDFDGQVLLDEVAVQTWLEQLFKRRFLRADREVDARLEVKRGQIDLLQAQVDDLKAERARLKEEVRQLRGAKRNG